jgi:hypothetical protein
VFKSAFVGCYHWSMYKWLPHVRMVPYIRKFVFCLRMKNEFKKRERKLLKDLSIILLVLKL